MKAIKTKLLKEFIYWMEERQRIYLKRKAKEPLPWTDDPILRTYRFCNVYREQDKVTIWIREQWREPFANHDNLWFAVAVARQINWPPSLKAIGFPKTWNPKRVLAILKEREALGLQLYSGAYMLAGGKNTRGMSKIVYTIENILDTLWEVSRTEGGRPPFLKPNCTLERATEWFTTFPGFGIGGFIAYEVVTDLRHTRYLCNAPDIHSWANPGLGARRGLNRLYGRDIEVKPPPKQLVQEMADLLCFSENTVNTDILPTLEMRDIETSLCEFDKYQRARWAPSTGKRCGLERFQTGNLYNLLS